MQEVWKDIYFLENNIEWDYRGLYQVSNYGNVKSLINNHGNHREKVLKVIKHKDGYCVVSLCKNGKIKTFYVHRLVAHMFCKGYEDGLEPDHINTIREDNRADNLHWKTRKENSNNPLTKENYSKAKKGKQLTEEHKRKLSEANKGKKIKDRCMLGKLIDRFDLDDNYIDTKYNFEYGKMGFDKSSISKCCKGKLKSHKSYIFKYHKDD